MIGTMIVAWILSLFDLDNLIITGINEIFNTDFTVAVYWLVAFIIGATICIGENIKN